MIDQQLLAEQLRRYQSQADTQAPQGRMAGRIYARPHALEYLAAGLRGYGGMKGVEDTQGKMRDMEEQQRKAKADVVRGFISDVSGTPAQPGTEGLEEFGRASIPAAPAVPGSLQTGYGRLASSQFPELQQMGMQGAVSSAQAQQQMAATLAAEERKRAQLLADKEAERQRIQTLMNDPNLTPQQKIALGIPEKAVDPNYGRSKVSKQVEVSGPNGEKLIQNLDEFGTPIGQPIPAYLAPVQINQGNQVSFVTPKSGVSLPVGMSPSEKDASARGWANVKLGRDRLESDKATAKGAAGASGAKTTEGERTAGALLQRLRSSQLQLSDALATKPDAAKPGLVASGLRAAGQEVAANALATSEERQQVEAAQLDILDAALTLGTGAAYTREQLEGYRKSYFPQIGDKPKTIADKQERLRNIIDAAEIKAGNAASQIPSADQMRAKRKPMSPEDTQARDWALQNPNDPRAKQILQRLGG